jgi:hypothetical protein
MAIHLLTKAADKRHRIRPVHPLAEPAQPVRWRTQASQDDRAIDNVDFQAIAGDDPELLPCVARHRDLEFGTDLDARHPAYAKHIRAS